MILYGAPMHKLPPLKFTWIECITGALAIIFLVIWISYWYKKSR